MLRKDVQGPLVVGPTCFNKVIAGVASFTSTEAVEVLPVPPLVELTVTELFFNPAVLPVTLTERVHDSPAGRLTPVTLTLEEPAAAVAVPPQELTILGVAATTSPAGRVSVKLTPLNVVEVFGLLMVNDNVVEPPVRIGFAANDLLMTGGATTVKEDVP